MTTRAGIYGALHRVKVTSAGIVRLHVAIPVGLTLDDYARRADALAVAFGAREARVSAAGTTSVWVELHRSDVLALTIRPLPVEPAQELNLGAVPIGRHEDGSPWCFSLWQTHVLIAGATGAGKGSILWSLLQGLSSAISAGWVPVWAIDPTGGMELRPGARLFSRFEDGTPETMCDLLEDLVAVMDARAKTLRAGLREAADLLGRPAARRAVPDGPRGVTVGPDGCSGTDDAAWPVSVRRADAAAPGVTG